MAVTEYYRWEDLGRPLQPAKAVEELVLQCRKAWPQATFSWGANAEHYQSNYPQDHTPFSYTGWPAASPRWWVFATDLMDNPGAGFDLAVVWPRVLADAKAGRVPHLKYLIHQAKLYDVRFGWKEQESSGHDHHIHVSFDTNAQFSGLGTWSIEGEQKMSSSPTVISWKGKVYLTVPGGRGRWWIPNDATAQALFKVWPGLGYTASLESQSSIWTETSVTTVFGPEVPQFSMIFPTPTATSASGMSDAQIRAIVREELDKTRFAH